MQVTFYELIATSLEKTLPKLLEKVYESNLKAVIRIESEERLKNLDSSMWTYTTLGFLPHGSKNDPKEFHNFQPIWLTTGLDNPIDAKVLVITHNDINEIEGFERILDVYNGNDESDVENAKQRLEVYKNLDYKIEKWKQNLKGGWEKLTDFTNN